MASASGSFLFPRLQPGTASAGIGQQGATTRGHEHDRHPAVPAAAVPGRERRRAGTIRRPRHGHPPGPTRSDRAGGARRRGCVHRAVPTLRAARLRRSAPPRRPARARRGVAAGGLHAGLARRARTPRPRARARPALDLRDRAQHRAQRARAQAPPHAPRLDRRGRARPAATRGRASSALTGAPRRGAARGAARGRAPGAARLHAGGGGAALQPRAVVRRDRRGDRVAGGHAQVALPPRGAGAARGGSRPGEEARDEAPDPRRRCSSCTSARRRRASGALLPAHARGVRRLRARSSRSCRDRASPRERLADAPPRDGLERVLARVADGAAARRRTEWALAGSRRGALRRGVGGRAGGERLADARARVRRRARAPARSSLGRPSPLFGLVLGVRRDARARAGAHSGVATGGRDARQEEADLGMALDRRRRRAGGCGRDGARRPDAVDPASAAFAERPGAREAAARRALARPTSRSSRSGSTRCRSTRRCVGRGRVALLRGAGRAGRSTCGPWRRRATSLFGVPQASVRQAQRDLRPRGDAPPQGGRLPRPADVPARASSTTATRSARETLGAEDKAGGAAGARASASGSTASSPRHELRALDAAQGGGRRRPRQPLPQADAGPETGATTAPTSGSRS